MTNEEHNKYIAWAFMAHGAFHMLMMLLMFLMMFLFFSGIGRPGDPGPPMAFFGFFFAFMLVFQAVFTAPSFVAAYGLLKKKSWARMASLIAGALAAMNVPVGTGACVYAFWFFLGENWKTVYPETHQDAEAPMIAYGVESQRAAYDAEATSEQRYQRQDPPDWR